uniref:Uncharacterized protein n=1 Tax=Oryza rufipogon TaxID=4529 RepID=A0A0E0N2T0_ORYRU
MRNALLSPFWNINAHSIVYITQGHAGFKLSTTMERQCLMESQIVGKNSIFRALPNNVLANAYRISREEARRLKHNRRVESGVFTPSHAYSNFQDIMTASL